MPVWQCPQLVQNSREAVYVKPDCLRGSVPKWGHDEWLILHCEPDVANEAFVKDAVDLFAIINSALR